MNAPLPPDPPRLDFETVCFVLNAPVRWRILRELAKGEALPVQELARRLGVGPSLISSHVGVLRTAGLAVVGYGRLYSLAAALRPAPGSATIDLGYCILRLDQPM